MLIDDHYVPKGVATMTVSVKMSSHLQSADKAKAAMDKAKAAVDKTIRDGADRLKTMSAGDLSGFISRLPAQDRGFLDRTAVAFRKMSPAQLDQVVAFMGTDQKRRLAAAFAKLPQSAEKTSNIPSGAQQSAGPAVIINRASTTYLGSLVYGKLKT